jgi:uncharacterized damage-inducible protein DinB
VTDETAAGPKLEAEDFEARTRRLLMEELEIQREHVIGIVEGLSDAQLREPKLPSGWSFLGMLQHLALDVEYYWLPCIVAGESLDFFAAKADDPDITFKVPPTLTGEAAIAEYRKQIAAANDVIAATPLDGRPKQRASWWTESYDPCLQEVLLHVITETACHAGHLDAARELVDGRKWMSFS